MRVLNGYSTKQFGHLRTWDDAFNALEEYLSTLPADRKRIVFIDEMPWMDSGRSIFVSALENFWNGWAMSQRNIMLVATGSATSWMKDKIVANKGGLHARVTCNLPLAPFTLNETERYLATKGIEWDRYQLTQTYMVLGGVPFYYSLLDSELSFTQNIDRLFFSLFYFRFLADNLSHDDEWWSNHRDSGRVFDWMGSSFGLVCMRHHKQIKSALGIRGIATSLSSWQLKPNKEEGIPGGQIDMIIERADRIVHLCEMKFSVGAYRIKPEYERQLRERSSLFKEMTKTNKTLVHTFITTYGVANVKNKSIAQIITRLNGFSESIIAEIKRINKELR